MTDVSINEQLHSSILWIHLPFSELSAHQLFAILSQRQAVFILEQQCLYQDIDAADTTALHVMGIHSSSHQLIAYSRILAPNTRFKEPSIGRVLVNSAYRKHKIGTLLIHKSLTALNTLYPNQTVRISAQIHLQSFYEALGFYKDSDPYNEDGILHIEMLKTCL